MQIGNWDTDTQAFQVTASGGITDYNTMLADLVTYRQQYPTALLTQSTADHDIQIDIFDAFGDLQRSIVPDMNDRQSGRFITIGNSAQDFIQYFAAEFIDEYDLDTKYLQRGRNTMRKLFG